MLFSIIMKFTTLRRIAALLSLVLLLFVVSCENTNDHVKTESKDWWSMVVSEAAEDISKLESQCDNDSRDDNNHFCYDNAYPVYVTEYLLFGDVSTIDDILKNCQYGIVVPYRNSTTFMLHHIYTKSENEEWVLHHAWGGTVEDWDTPMESGEYLEEYYADKDMFLLNRNLVNDAINAYKFKSIDDIWFVFDESSLTTFVCISSGGKEFVIPFSATTDRIRMEQGSVYTINQCIINMCFNYHPIHASSNHASSKIASLISLLQTLRSLNYSVIIPLLGIVVVIIVLLIRRYRRRAAPRKNK